MSPRAADPAVRARLIEAAARLLAEHGRDAVTLRGLAAEVGTSTMSIYTHFGGMDEVRAAVRREAFARFGAALAAVRPGDDPVDDLLRLGRAYHQNAVANPHLYHAMFSERAPEGDPSTGAETFAVLVDAVRRCIDAGRFAPGDPVVMARQLWALQHGAISLLLAGLLDEQLTIETVTRAGAALISQFGTAAVAQLPVPAGRPAASG